MCVPLCVFLIGRNLSSDFANKPYAYIYWLTVNLMNGFSIHRLALTILSLESHCILTFVIHLDMQ